jgi:hypothetical protein
MTRSSILYTRSSGFVFTDLAIRAWDAGHMRHVGVRIGQTVIDASFWHGVARWDLAEWLEGRTLVGDIPVHATSIGSQEQAETNLINRIGQRYDAWEIAGYLLLRDLGDPDRPVCSRLGYDYLSDACGLRIPGRQGRIGPRLLHAAHHSYNTGLLISDNRPAAPTQPS